MQEETTQRTIALVFRATAFTARHFDALLREIRKDFGGNQQTAPQSRRNGKVSVRNLVGQPDKVSTIEIPDDLRSFEKIAKRHNVAFAVKRDKSVTPPKFIIFFKAKDMDVLKECFKDYLNVQKQKQITPTFKERLGQFREKAEQMHRTLQRAIERGERSL